MTWKYGLLFPIFLTPTLLTFSSSLQPTRKLRIEIRCSIRTSKN